MTLHRLRTRLAAVVGLSLLLLIGAGFLYAVWSTLTAGPMPAPCHNAQRAIVPCSASTGKEEPR